MQQKVAIVVILSASLFSTAGYANSYDRGIKLYRRADFKGAEMAFSDVLRSGVNRATKGRVYKYIGLSQYMLGRKKDARASFHSALRYDPKTEIYPDEALDSSVLEFFLQIKQDRKKGIGVATSAPPGRTYRPTTTKRVAPKAVAKKPAAKRVVPKPLAPKQTGRKASSSKRSKQSTSTKRQVVKKKVSKDTLFTGKSKKPPRVIFKEREGISTPRTGQLLLPPDAKADTHYYRESSNLWRFLPFGVGQYVNDNYKLGHAFAAAGILSFGGFVLYQFLLQEETAVLDEHYATRNEHAAKCETQPNYCKTVAEYDNEFLPQWEDYVASVELYSYLYLAGFAAVWAGGVIEAMVNRPATKNYSLLPRIHYGYEQQHRFALLWQYQLP